jgi:hypothetical protein
MKKNSTFTLANKGWTANLWNFEWTKRLASKEFAGDDKIVMTKKFHLF